jgi:hypothetical protein
MNSDNKVATHLQLLPTKLDTITGCLLTEYYLMKGFNIDTRVKPNITH